MKLTVFSCFFLSFFFNLQKQPFYMVQTNMMPIYRRDVEVRGMGYISPDHTLLGSGREKSSLRSSIDLRNPARPRFRD